MTYKNRRHISQDNKPKNPEPNWKWKAPGPEWKYKAPKAQKTLQASGLFIFDFFCDLFFLFLCVNVTSNRITCKRIWIESGRKHKEISRQELLNIFNQLMEAWFCNAYLKIVKTYNMWFNIAWLTYDFLALSSPLRQCACWESSPGHKHGRLVWCRYTTCAVLQRFSGCV